MGLFARFTCLRHDGTVEDVAQAVRDLLRSQNVVETPDQAAAERLIMIAPAGDGWLMVEDPSAPMADADGLLAELGRTCGKLALEIIVADSDDLVFLLTEDGEPQAQLTVDRRGLRGAVEPWQHLLLPGQAVGDIRKAFAKPTTFIEEHLPALKPLFGIDLAAFGEIDRLLSGHSLREDAVLLYLKAVPASGQDIGPPKLEVDERQRQNHIVNRSFPQIPLGLVTNFPAFSFHSRGGRARGLHVRLTGSALELGLVKITSAMLRRYHPIDHNLNQDIKVAPEMTPAGVVLRFPELDVPDWVEPNVTAAMQARRALQDLLVFVCARGVKVGDGELVAEAHLVEPESAPIVTSYPVTVLPAMWRPLKGSDQPHMIHYVRALNDPARINCLAVLRGGPDEAVGPSPHARNLAIVGRSGWHVHRGSRNGADRRARFPSAGRSG